MLMLPYPPSANRYWRHSGHAIYRSEDAESFVEEVQWIAVAQKMRPLAGPVAVELRLHPVRPKDWAKREAENPHLWQLDVRRIDVDNCAKVLLDALQGIAFENDRQITTLHVQLATAIDGGGIAVRVQPDQLWITK